MYEMASVYSAGDDVRSPNKLSDSSDAQHYQKVYLSCERRLGLSGYSVLKMKSFQRTERCNFIIHCMFL